MTLEEMIIVQNSFSHNKEEKENVIEHLKSFIKQESSDENIYDYILLAKNVPPKEILKMNLVQKVTYLYLLT